MWLVGLDLGQSADATAVAVVEQSSRPLGPHYQCRWLERWLGVSYVEQVRRVVKLLSTPPLHDARLIVDRTGVGRGVYDMFREHLQPLGVTVHGGDKALHEGDAWRVPKRDLIFAAVAVLQSQRLQISQQLPEAATLVQELQNYRIKINTVTAHDSYSAWREGQHDDLVFALSLALWAGESGAAAPLGIWSLSGPGPGEDREEWRLMQDAAAW